MKPHLKTGDRTVGRCWSDLPQGRVETTDGSPMSVTFWDGGAGWVINGQTSAMDYGHEFRPPKIMRQKMPRRNS